MDMSRLITLNGNDDKKILDSIFNEEIIVYEDVQGSQIWVNWDGDGFNIRTKSVNNDTINLVDMAMQNYYNPAIKFFESLDERVISLLNKKWHFGFEYFPDNYPANIEYQNVPKNNLVLTSIYKKDKYVFDIDELGEYSRLFDVNMIPIIYQGRLTERMIESIKYFLNTSEDDLEYVFGEKSFSFFFYKILNPPSSSSFLMEDSFQENVEKIIIRTKNNDISFELLNPLYKKMSLNNSSEFVEVYSLILLNFLNFCQSLNIEELTLKGSMKDEAYIYLISKIFNIYIHEVKDDLLNFDFVIPNFFKKGKFKINTELIPNKMTKLYIKESEKLEYIFKIIIGSFNKKRKKPIGVFTENTVILFNKFVETIDNLIDKHLKKLGEKNIIRKGLLDFEDYFKIEYDTDAEGDVYIQDIYNTFQKADDKKKKYDKKGKITIAGGKPDESEK